MTAIKDAINVDTSNFVRAGEPTPISHEIEEYLLPPRNVIQICSSPNIPGIFPSTNNIIDFHIGGKVPQYRAPLPAPVSTQGTSTTTSSVVSSSSSSTSTNNPPTAQTASTTTPVLAPGAQFAGTILMAKSFYAYKLAVNVACRVELYGSSTAQSADLTRSLGTPPGLGTIQGIISDVQITSAPAIWFYQDTEGSNQDTPQSNVIYLTVTNLGASSQAITVTITYIPLQS